MASGTRLRTDGQRKSVNMRSRDSSLISKSMGVPMGEVGEHRLNLKQVWALEHMFESNPAVKAARTVLSGQLLSGGISLRKEGRDVPLTPAFKDHLNEVWLPFAQEIIDCLLKWGFVPVVYEEHEDEYRRSALLAKRRKVEEATGKGKSKAAKASSDAVSVSSDSPIIVPMVPMLGSYDIAFRMGGRQGYKREYYVYSTNPSNGVMVDEEARVIVRQHPDSSGNINSPLASVFELGSFVSAITELALIAESSRARPRIVTQMVKKNQSAMDPANLFYDSESRAVQSGADLDENAGQARALQLQHQMCSLINKLQTRMPLEHETGSFSGSKMSAGKTSYAPPEISPSLFNIPKDQELTSGGSSPESRGDLEALTRLSIEQFSAAFGVPSDLIFSGRYAGKSTSQLSLLNITVSQLSKAVNGVLSIAYRDIYASSSTENIGQLQLLTSPLSATEEVLHLYQGGLVPLDIAMPSVLHSIGATKEEIDRSVEEAKKKEEEKIKEEASKKIFEENDNKISLDIKQAELEHRKKDIGNPNVRESSDARPSSSGSKPKAGDNNDD